MLLKPITIPSLSICLLLIACGGSSGGDKGVDISPDDPLFDIQGKWVSSECEDGGDGTSYQVQLTFSGSTMTESGVGFFDSANCNGTQTFSTNVIASIVVSDEVTSISGVDAKHMDVAYSRVTMTASQETHAGLAAQGTSLQAFASSLGYSNINNIPLSLFGLSPTTLHTVYRVNNNLLTLGADSLSNDGSSAALRHNQLDSINTFTK